MSDRNCACIHDDARACFLIRNPDCNRFSDVPWPHDLYEVCFDEECECSCHDLGEDEYLDSVDEYVR